MDHLAQQARLGGEVFGFEVGRWQGLDPLYGFADRVEDAVLIRVENHLLSFEEGVDLLVVFRSAGPEFGEVHIFFREKVQKPAFLPAQSFNLAVELLDGDRVAASVSLPLSAKPSLQIAQEVVGPTQFPHRFVDESEYIPLGYADLSAIPCGAFVDIVPILPATLLCDADGSQGRVALAAAREPCQGIVMAIGHLAGSPLLHPLDPVLVTLLFVEDFVVLGIGLNQFSLESKFAVISGIGERLVNAGGRPQQLSFAHSVSFRIHQLGQCFAGNVFAIVGIEKKIQNGPGLGIDFVLESFRIEAIAEYCRTGHDPVSCFELQGAPDALAHAVRFSLGQNPFEHEVQGVVGIHLGREAESVVVQMYRTTVFVDEVEDELDVGQVAGQPVHGFEDHDVDSESQGVFHHRMEMRAGFLAGALNERIVCRNGEPSFAGIAQATLFLSLQAGVVFLAFRADAVAGEADGSPPLPPPLKAGPYPVDFLFRRH